MAKHSDSIYLKHIVEAAHKIIQLVNRGGKDLYDADFAISDAVVRELMVIGEASRNLSEEAKRDYPTIPWKDVIGMRDWLVHGYSEIDWERVWNTAVGDIPFLIQELNRDTRLNE